MCWFDFLCSLLPAWAQPIRVLVHWTIVIYFRLQVFLSIYDLKRKKMSKYEKSREELRIVKSVEQIVPFLKDLDDERNQSADEDDCEVAIESNAEKTDGNSSETLATDSDATICGAFVNFIDLSILDPIVEAKNCQPDVLIESEISEPTMFLPWTYRSALIPSLPVRQWTCRLLASSVHF